jgi:hypothetical protein
VSKGNLKSDICPLPHAGHNMGAMHSGRGTLNYGKLGGAACSTPPASPVASAEQHPDLSANSNMWYHSDTVALGETVHTSIYLMHNVTLLFHCR